MKIDDREDALRAARRLADGKLGDIADALLEAHLEGIEQAVAHFFKARVPTTSRSNWTNAALSSERRSRTNAKTGAGLNPTLGADIFSR